MPYKSAKDTAKAMRDYRERKRITVGITQGGDNAQGITEEGTYFKEGVEYVPATGILPERPRYLTLSDGQVLDRANPPLPNPVSESHRVRMLACNRSNELSRGISKQRRLAMILRGLDKEITLDKRVNILTMVRYGIGGPTLKEVSDAVK